MLAILCVVLPVVFCVWCAMPKKKTALEIQQEWERAVLAEHQKKQKELAAKYQWVFSKKYANMPNIGAFQQCVKDGDFDLLENVMNTHTNVVH